MYDLIAFVMILLGWGITIFRTFPDFFDSSKYKDPDNKPVFLVIGFFVSIIAGLFWPIATAWWAWKQRKYFRTAISEFFYPHIK